METEKLYYRDSYQKHVRVRILDRKTDQKGIWLLPDKTIAYPGGGGQIADTVTFNGTKARGVNTEGNQIWYLLPENCCEADEEAVMQIDWDVRYYNMQQHTGQHLFSAVMKRHGYDTVSVHLGEAYTLVEFKGTIPDRVLLDRVEAECNEAIRAGAAVRTFWISPEEADAYPLRRPPGDWDRLRLVQIEGIDYVACGGTHVRNTTGIGYIKLADVEKIRGHVRIRAYIGARADEYFRTLHRLHEELKRLLHMDATGMAERIQNLLEERNSLKRLNDLYVTYYLKARGEALMNEERMANGLVVYRMDETDGPYAEELARTLAHDMGIPAFIMYENRFFFNVPEQNRIDPNRFLKEHRETFGIKGGGPPGFVQGVFMPEKTAMLIKALESL